MHYSKNLSHSANAVMVDHIVSMTNASRLALLPIDEPFTSHHAVRKLLKSQM
jgi:hypothetical protein